MKSVNWGILGNARIARSSVIPALLKDPRSNYYALASRAGTPPPEEARPEKIYTDYAALLEDPKVDAVYIPLPNALHYEWSLKAMKKGKHVLCEKPLALTAAEVERMIGCAEENQVVLMEAFMYRYTHRTRQIERVLQSGKLGQIRYVYASWRFLLNRKNTIKEEADLGGGSLFDVGCYPVNFLGMITDQRAEKVQAMTLVPGEVDTLFAGTVQYPDGLTAQISSGFNAFSQTHGEIIGDRGKLIVPDPFAGQSGTLCLHTDKGVETISVEESDRYGEEIRNFSLALTGGDGWLFSLEESLRNAELLERLAEAGKG